jgi:hypothetical protein
LIDVQLARKTVEGLGLEIATRNEAREILDLKGGDKLEVRRFGDSRRAARLEKIAAKMSHLAGSPH